MYLESNIIGWAKTRGILATGTPIGQAKKLLEEAGEVLGEVTVDSMVSGNHVERVEKEIGDVLVTAIILAEMYGLTTDSCLSVAWDSIKDRKGKMANGQFVKEV